MKKSDKFLAHGFVFLLIGFLAVNLFSPDRAFSIRENRYLSPRPQLSLRSIFNGTFTWELEEYITDEFFLRDNWVLLKADMEGLLLRRENNGIYLGSSGYLLENYRPGRALEANTRGILRFANQFQDLPTYVLMIPNSVAIYPDNLPAFAPVFDQVTVIDELRSRLGDSVNFVDIHAALRDNRQEYIYFRTDHHWTMRGAFYGYQEIGKSLGFTPLPQEHFDKVVVSRDFWGTYSSRANSRRLESDYIEVFKGSKPVKISFGDSVWHDSLFFPEHLENRDKYSYFLNGNHPLMVIKSQVENDNKLVVFKDSYAHNMLPFLANHYSEIHVIDLRYFIWDLGKYIEEHGFDQALFLFNISTFSVDRGLVSYR